MSDFKVVGLCIRKVHPVLYRPTYKLPNVIFLHTDIVFDSTHIFECSEIIVIPERNINLICK